MLGSVYGTITCLARRGRQYKSLKISGWLRNAVIVKSLPIVYASATNTENPIGKGQGGKFTGL